MSDNQKTVTFLVVGAVALLVGFAPWRSTAVGPTVEEEQGQKLFKDFENALSASSMEVIEFNEDTSTIKPFKVAQVNGIWSIPSHQNYPADARDHLAAAATALIDLDILGVAGTSPGEHELFGVIEPDVTKLKAGATGVGERVVMKDGKDNVLADLIIGKEVKDQPGVRYVRRTGKDPVYRVKVATDKFSTKFEDWIEKDLLKLNTFDIREIDLNDYTLQQGINRQGQLTIGQAKGSNIKLAYDDAKSEWKLVECVKYEKNKPVPANLAEGEELNTEKLNELRNAFDDLKIVDVERKPEGLNGDLSLKESVTQDQAQLQQLAESLAVRGFVPVALDENKFSLLSTDGEVIVKLKDGVDYVVRFGQVAPGSDKKEGKTGLDRFVMITAQLDKSAIPEPELEALPEEEPKKEEPKGEESKADAAKPGEKKPEAKPEEKAEEKKEPTAEEAAASKAALEEKRAQVEKANQRKLDEYNEKLKAAQKKVDDLNSRFADWYYVIGDDVYKKVHLTRADVVKTKEKKPGEGDTIGDFKELDKGLEKK